MSDTGRRPVVAPQGRGVPGPGAMVALWGCGGCAGVVWLGAAGLLLLSLTVQDSPYRGAVQDAGSASGLAADVTAALEADGGSELRTAVGSFHLVSDGPDAVRAVTTEETRATDGLLERIAQTCTAVPALRQVSLDDTARGGPVSGPVDVPC